MKLILSSKKKLLDNLYKDFKNDLKCAKSYELDYFYRGWAWGMCEIGIITYEEREEAGRQISKIIKIKEGKNEQRRNLQRINSKTVKRNR